MKYRHLIFIICFAVIITSLNLACSRDSKTNNAYQKLNFAGDIDITASGKSSKLDENSAITENTEIKVNADAQLDIVISDNDIIRLKAGATAEITKLNDSKIEIKLKKGSAFFKMPSISSKNISFKLTTPNATCGVRGTNFMAETGAGKDIVATLEGSVEVSGKTSGNVIINTGELTEILPGRPPLEPQMILESIKPYLTLEVALMRPDLAIGAARSTVAVFDIKTIQRTLENYYAMNGKYPESIRKMNIKDTDPWDTPLIYYLTDNGYVLFSAGPDGIIGTFDDIQIIK